MIYENANGKLKHREILTHEINSHNIDYALPKLIYDLEKIFEEQKVNNLFVIENFSIQSEIESGMDEFNHTVKFSYCKLRSKEDAS